MILLTQPLCVSTFCLLMILIYLLLEKSAYLKANIVLEKVHEYMYSNQLHINTEKSCYMHIHPSLNSTARLTCARSKPLNCGLKLKIGSEKL